MKTGTADIAMFNNEVQGDYVDTITDPQGEYEDWVELFNGMEVTVYIEGYFLTDDLGVPDQWEFPAETEIAPEGFLVVWMLNIMLRMAADKRPL